MWAKVEIVRGEEGLEGVSTSAPPPGNFNYTPCNRRNRGYGISARKAILQKQILPTSHYSKWNCKETEHLRCVKTS